MWIILNKSFLSIVKNRNDENELLVRARVKGDIQRVFKNAKVFEDPKADYLYRSYINRDIVAETIQKELININYDNYVKNFETDTKSILNYINLEWEEKIKSYDKTNRVVTTASFQQVRGKIKKDTSKGWRKYSDNLIRMQKVLAKFKINF